jgi:SlyX protein
MEERLVKLETKVAHQDHIIEELNSVVTDQQQEIDQLKEQVKAVVEHIRTGVPFDEEGGPQPSQSPYG